ncbi:hypothetical protein [Stenotrophomonas oahuensis]|uniref:Uncharacterized protein n=1 Tax=Stenotrophomonas oahuensis TaxID=3003271 RepID=A0ABY9YKC0_9GAMM|nr:hypothetical protein [Stenotrophomonas sp. A5586]WNH51341.1 hypothetical protein PDM29_13315 [Stenotrophomonas sp. A5586]
MIISLGGMDHATSIAREGFSIHFSWVCTNSRPDASFVGRCLLIGSLPVGI